MGRSSRFIAIGHEVLQCEVGVAGHCVTEYVMTFERLHFGLGDFEGILEYRSIEERMPIMCVSLTSTCTFCRPAD